MQILAQITPKLTKLWEDIRESEAFQQLKARYDELDGQTKLYVNLGAVAGVVLAVTLTVLIGVAKVSGLKSDINDKEELIGYLNQAAEQIRRLKAQQAARGSADTSSPLPTFVDSLLNASAIDPAKAEIGPDKPGADSKDAVETLISVKLSQINLRQLTKFLYNATVQGQVRNLNVKDLTVDTKGNDDGFLDVDVSLATYRAK